jgi:hypothetical protein
MGQKPTKEAVPEKTPQEVIAAKLETLGKTADARERRAEALEVTRKAQRDRALACKREGDLERTCQYSLVGVRRLAR